MVSIDRPLSLSRPEGLAQVGGLPFAGLLALAMMVPMIVSGVVFRTYDITMATLPMEMFRQFNFPFVLAEMVVIVAAAPGGFRLRDAVAGSIGRVDGRLRSSFSPSGLAASSCPKSRHLPRPSMLSI